MVEHVEIDTKILGLFSLYEIKDKLWDFWSWYKDIMRW